MGNHQPKSPHRLAHNERAAFLPVEVRTLTKGDVFVRQGAPCMIVEPPVDVAHYANQEGVGHLAGGVWIVNLHSGGCWPILLTEQVYPAHDVKLTFSSGRREC